MYPHHRYKTTVSTISVADAGFAQIIPTSLQLFDYSSVSFKCKSAANTTGWRVMRKISGEVSTCVTNWETGATFVCAIKPVYPSDSGEYWCETGDGARSNSVHITVTGAFADMKHICSLNNNVEWLIVFYQTSLTCLLVLVSWLCDPGESCPSCAGGRSCDSALQNQDNLCCPHG